jgi:DUF4097 and DUF4098 domain-containing protein YvlB
MKTFLLAALTCLPLASIAGSGDVSKVNSSIRIGAGEHTGDVSTVNGSIHIEDGATADNVGTVNGSIEIGSHAVIQRVKTVNGGISLGADTKATNLQSVNGTLKLAENVQVNGDVTAVNGAVVLGQGANVTGTLSNVNGRMTLAGARVGEGLKTVSGDIEIRSGSRVQGGILVEKPTSKWRLIRNRPPRVVIGPNAVVEGTLKFEHEVELLVSDRAKIGEVEGASVVRFSGEQPR